VNFFSLDSSAGSSWDQFLHKIPYFTFFGLVILMMILSAWKKLSLIPVMGLISCSYLMTELGIANWQRFGIWLLIGLVIYFCYGFRNSKMK